MTGYTNEYYTNQNQSNTYETFPDEIRHKGQLPSQLQLIRMGIDQYAFLGAGYAYGLGTTLESQHNADARVFYFDSGTENEVGLSLYVLTKRSRRSHAAKPANCW